MYKFVYLINKYDAYFTANIVVSDQIRMTPTPRRQQAASKHNFFIKFSRDLFVYIFQFSCLLTKFVRQTIFAVLFFNWTTLLFIYNVNKHKRFPRNIQFLKILR